MSKNFSDIAFEQYMYWQQQDRKTLKKINQLIQDIYRNGADKGIGKPEPLKHRPGWSRRIDEKNRIVYEMDMEGNLYIISCQGHYDD